MLCKLDIYLSNFALENTILSTLRGRVQCLSPLAPHPHLIAAHFTELQELHLEVLKVDAKDMWMALGPTLESLSIRIVMPDVYKGTVRNIQTFCRKLSSVDIGFSGGLWEGHAALYMSYVELFNGPNRFEPRRSLVRTGPLVSETKCSELFGFQDNMVRTSGFPTRSNRFDCLQGTRRARVHAVRFDLRVGKTGGIDMSPVPASHRPTLAPLLKATPVRAVSGISVVAVMSKPH